LQYIAYQSEAKLLNDFLIPPLQQIRNTKKFSLVKAKEILAWLHEHPGVDKWIVIQNKLKEKLSDECK